MANQPYYPNREGDQLTWLTNLQTKIPDHYTALGIGGDRQLKLGLTLSWLVWTWGTFLPSRRKDAPAATAWRNQLASGSSDASSTPVQPPVPATLPPPSGLPYFGMLTWLFEEIVRWKSAEGYNETIGRSLAIIGASQSAPDLTTLQPRLSATASGGSVKITWSWQGWSTFLDLLEITVDRSDGKGFVPLAFDTTPNYEDTAPYPATPVKWSYKAIYRVADHQVGQWSAPISVTVGG
ncbi:MAG: hypothetical protein V4726_09910 [Verrucomicrobiota bacterium]